MNANDTNGGRLAGVVDRFAPLADRFNPILVKEVRQTLRGRSFGWTFLTLVVVVAIIGAIIVLMDETNPSTQLGKNFSILLVWLLGIGTIVVVPLQVFQSLGNEWEAETYDQLTLSGLTPSQIASGKLLSAALQSALLLAAFLPFIALGFLMRGVDLVAVLVVLLVLFCASLWASALALALSATSRARSVRVVLYVLLAIGAFMGLGSAGGFGSSLLSFPAVLAEPDFASVLVSVLLGGFCVSAVAHAFGRGQLAHPEENSATPLRLTTAISVVVLLGWLVLAVLVGWLGGDVAQVTGAVLCVILAFMSMLWTAERQRLGRRVAFDLSSPKSRARRTPSMLLPGGSRGAQFSYLLIGLAATFVVLIDPSRDFSFEDQRWFGVWVLSYYSFFVAMPAALLSRWCERPSGAWAVRLLMLLFAAACIVMPAIAGLLLNDPGLTKMRHPLNPIWVLAESMDNDLPPLVGLAVIGLGALGLAVNVVRIARGTAEVLRARRGEHHEPDPAVERSRERMAAS